MSHRKSICRRQWLKNSAATVAAGVTATGMFGAVPTTQAQTAIIPRKWDQETDVVVVGSGPMGLPASIAAAEKGGSVVVLEQGKVTGGCGRLAAGVLNLGGGTRIQRLNGVDDTKELLYQRLTHYTLANGKKNDPVWDPWWDYYQRWLKWFYTGSW